ncbi:hypothetical protein [Bellilinea sp.]
MNPIDDFLSTLASPRTAARYRAALEEFTAWYRRTNGAEPDWNLLTPVEVKDYTAYLQSVRGLVRVERKSSMGFIGELSSGKKHCATQFRAFICPKNGHFEGIFGGLASYNEYCTTTLCDTQSGNQSTNF